MKKQIFAFLFACFVSGALGKDAEFYFENGLFRDAIQFLDECGNKDLLFCFKERALKYLELLPNDLNIGGILEIKSHVTNRTARFYEVKSLPKDLKEREEAINNMLIAKVFDYLKSHTIELKVPDEAIKDLEQSVEEGRKKKNKKGGGMMPILILAKLKAVALAAIAMKAIALIAFKALLVAKVALTISLVIALKKLLEQKHSSTYEVVAHPHYEEHGHYDRSFGQDIAYSGYEEYSKSTSVHS